MAGASNNERQDAYIAEVTPGTTPATPAFTKVPFDELQMTGNPRISEAQLIAFQGQRSGIGRNGIAVAGQARGKLLYGEYDTFFESLFQDQWTTDVLINDYEQYTMTIEQGIPEGAGGTMHYTRFRGVEAVSGTIVLTAGQDAEVTFDLIGFGSDDAANTIIAGATYTDPTNTNVLGSGSDIGTINFGSLSLTSCIQSLTIDWGVVGKDEQLRISSDDACGINRGVMRPIITGNFYVETDFLEVYNEARNGTTTFAMTVPLGSVTTEKYTIEFPACQFVEAPLITALEGPAFQQFRILPIYDAGGIDATCRLTRAVV